MTTPAPRLWVVHFDGECTSVDPAGPKDDGMLFKVAKRKAREYLLHKIRGLRYCERQIRAMEEPT